ncbi:MAG: cytochrome c [Acidiferrobacterales bacterium]
MKKVNHHKLASLSFMLLFALGIMSNASAADAKKLVNSKCASCHGRDGNSTDGKTPGIAGISIDYFIESMEAYKTDARPARKLKGQKKDMRDEARELSDENIKALANYFNKQKYKPQKQKFDPVLAEAGKKLQRKFCERCHTEGGSSADDDAGILAGQPISYLEYSMNSFASGKREMGNTMARKFKSMQKQAGDKGIAQLVHYYASQQ